MKDPTPERIFLEHLPFLKKLAAATARRRKASAEEGEEFTSELWIKLIEDDYAVIRGFKGDSKLETYLTVVVTNAFTDFQNQRWGRWRPSAEAKRLGPVAIRLSELIEKDRFTFDEACEILIANYKVEESRKELEEIWKRLPIRTRREMEGEEALEELPTGETSPVEDLLEGERQKRWREVSAALQTALDRLPDEDRLIFRLVTLKGIKIVAVARMFGLDQKSLYRRLENIKKLLREYLKEEGVGWEDIEDLLL